MASELIGPRVDPTRRMSHVRKVYHKNCSVCSYLQKNPDFRRRVMQSRYFQPDGQETLKEVVHNFGDPLKISTIYMHMARHQPADLMRAKKRFTEPRREIEAPLPDEAKVLDTIDSSVLSQGYHERALDDFISQGREKLLKGELSITATTLLAAIKIRSEIDKSTKDRRLDMIKSFFAGGGNKEATPVDG